MKSTTLQNVQVTGQWGARDVWEPLRGAGSPK